MIGNKEICKGCIHKCDSQYLGYCYLNAYPTKHKCENGDKYKTNKQ